MQKCEKKKPWYERGCLVGSLDSGLFWGEDGRTGFTLACQNFFIKATGVN